MPHHPRLCVSSRAKTGSDHLHVIAEKVSRVAELCIGHGHRHASARYSEAKTPEAARMLNESIQKATDRKWKRTEFDALAAKAEIESQAGATPSTRLLAKRLQADAHAAGFALIARKAGALAK
jgi:nicotinamide mononucleotide adenylyltransferase